MAATGADAAGVSPASLVDEVWPTDRDSYEVLTEIGQYLLLPASIGQNPTCRILGLVTLRI